LETLNILTNKYSFPVVFAHVALKLGDPDEGLFVEKLEGGDVVMPRPRQLIT
jgi:hypothetical protein